MSTIFLAGIYGVGKSTLAERISATTGLPCFSAGDLISRVNGEKYGANKFVTDKEKNQDILAVSDLSRGYSRKRTHFEREGLKPLLVTIKH